jgi:hypothetical protein
MEAVKGIASKIVRRLGRLSNARDENGFVWFYFQRKESVLNSLKDGMVAAARAPGHRVITTILFQTDHVRLLTRAS